MSVTDLARAREVAGAVVDPELPMLTLADLGVLREVTVQDGTVVVTLTPTYTGCPALATMKADVRLALAEAGFAASEVRVALTPAWSTDWISARGRAALQVHGIAPPGPVPHAGPTDLVLRPAPPAPTCPRCGSAATREVSRFGPTACTAQHVCGACGEPFEKVKEL